MLPTQQARDTVARPSPLLLIDARGQCAHPPAEQRESIILLFSSALFLSFSYLLFFIFFFFPFSPLNRLSNGHYYFVVVNCALFLRNYLVRKMPNVFVTVFRISYRFYYCTVLIHKYIQS